MTPTIEPLLTSLRDRIAKEKDLAGRDLLSLVRPSIRLGTKRVPFARIAIGESRIGGVPDVPQGFEWPRWLPTPPQDDKFGNRWRPESPAPLGFIAQIDLSAMPHVDDSLPKSGWLYFFYDRYSEPWGFDPADRGCCRVSYAECDRSSLARIEPPGDVDGEHVAHVCQVEAWPELTLPDDLADLVYDTPEYNTYFAIRDELIGSWGATHNRLLGHPQVVQNPMELECQLVTNGIYCGSSEGYEGDERKTLEAGAADWRLLLQIDTDDEPGWMWGDVGRIYFWIRKQDLALRRFDDVWLIFQCS
jgi:uncharacterized protein YwqG